MKKFLQLLMLTAALCLPWAVNAQVGDYVMTTGVDAGAWLTPASETIIVASGQDDGVSSVESIGFAFPYGGNVYTQFSANSNGRIRLGNDVISSEYGNPFVSSYSSSNLPKIAGVGKDCSSGAAGYVKKGLTTVDGVNVCVVNFRLNNTSNSSGTDYVNFQIQLFATGKVRIVYGTSASSLAAYQIGLSGAAGDIWTVNPSTHEASYSNGFASATYTAWPGEGRFYEFAEPAFQCPKVRNLAADNIAGTSAMLSWTLSNAENAADRCDLELIQGGSVVRTYTNVTSPYLLGRLVPSTPYTVRVTAYCGSETGEDATVDFSTGCFSNDEMNITGGTSSSHYYMPVNYYYGNSASQQLVLASELNGPASITSVSFNFVQNTTLSKNNCSIYLSNTDLSSLSTSSYVPQSDLVLVYYGPITVHQGWNNITFDTPFEYDGVSNLAITVYENNGSYPGGSSSKFATHAVSGRVLYYQNDNTPFTYGSSSWNAFGYRNDMRFFSCNNNVGCVAPAAMVSNVTYESAQIDWIPGYLEESWTVEYKTADASDWTVAVASTSAETYTLTGLLPNTEYMVRVGALCDDETAYYTENFRTECHPYLQVPHFEDFESYASGTGNRVDCWLSGSTYSSSYPYVSGSYGVGGGKSYYMYTSGDTYTYLVSPAIDPTADVRELYTNVSLYRTSGSGKLMVGVMSDPNDLSTFYPVATVNPASTYTWQDFDVYFDNLPAEVEANHIAYAVTNGPLYMDNVAIDNIPACGRPMNIEVAEVSSSSLTIAWTGSAESYEIAWASSSDFDYADTPVEVTGNSYTITDLTPNSVYWVWVRSFCAGDEESRWVMLDGFAHTDCEPMQLTPYVYGFEDANYVNSPYYCWDIINTTDEYANYVGVGTGNAATGSRSLYLYTSADFKSYAIMPEFDADLNTLMVSFNLRTNTTNNCMLDLGVMTDPADISTFQTIATLNPTITFENYSVFLNSYEGQGRIALRCDNSNGLNAQMYIDDIEVTEMPTCPALLDVTVEATVGSARVEWTKQEFGT